jgi:phosphoglycolate phosphatase
MDAISGGSIRLLLFDIDGTLLDPRGAGGRAVGRALKIVFGIRGEPSESCAGKTDPEILRETLRTTGIEPSHREESVERFFRVYLEELEREIETRPDFVVYPGVRPLLEKLSRISFVRLGLLTGNIEAAARRKLTAVNLNRFFPTGAFGSDGENRIDLARIAIERASAHFAVAFRAADTVIIGDTDRDVACARAVGAHMVGVGTGVRGPEPLLA